MKKKKNKYLFYIIIIFAGLFIYAFEQIESERTQLKINNIKSDIKSELERQASQKIELSKLESPKYLDIQAKKMNFVLPVKEDIILLQKTK